MLPGQKAQIFTLPIRSKEKLLAEKQLAVCLSSEGGGGRIPKNCDGRQQRLLLAAAEQAEGRLLTAAVGNTEQQPTRGINVAERGFDPRTFGL